MNLKHAPLLIFSRLPLWFLYWLSDLTFILVYYVLKYRRKVVSSNLVAAFPDLTVHERRKIELGFYRHLCDFIFETVKLLTIKESQIQKRFAIKNGELIDTYYAKERSVIAYSGHLGNWEWLACLPTYIPHHVTTFYKPLKNGYYDELVRFSRSRFGIETIASKKGYRALKDLENKAKVTYNHLFGDQRPRRSSNPYPVHFLNQETYFFIGADRIARKMGMAVVFPWIRKKSRGYYELEFVELTQDASKTDSHELITGYAKALEKAIIEDPALWLWSHRRWKS